jgi:hypothetical protein
MAHFAFKRMDTLLVLVHDGLAPSDDAWQRYLEVCAQLDRSLPASTDQARALIFTDGGVPTGPQRTALSQILKGRAAISAVVSDSMLIRSSIGLFSIINPGLKVFPSADWKKAAAFARIDEARQLDVLKVAVGLAREVGESRVLRAIGL